MTRASSVEPEPEPDGLGNTYPVVTIHGITGSDQNFEDGIDLSYHGDEWSPPRSLMDLFAGAKADAELPTPLPANLLRNVEVSNEVLGQVADWIDGRRADEWTLAPGRLGPLYVGMSADEAIATGFVEQAPPDTPCDVDYQATAPAEVGLFTEFRFGDPERLGDMLVKGTTPQTAEGVGVGTPIDRLRAVYGDRLVEVEPAPEWNVQYCSSSSAATERWCPCPTTVRR